MTDRNGCVKQIKEYLADIASRKPGSRHDDELARLMASSKTGAVENHNEPLAKQLWCYQTVHRCQNTYITAFYDMKARHFYRAWCALETVEGTVNSLERHFDLGGGGSDKYKLMLIRKNTEQFQRLYPYSAFFSIGASIHEQVCSICEQVVSLRTPCGHQVGEIYSGEMCARVITRADLREVALVDRPTHKYTVVFTGGKGIGKAQDHYNYAHIHYVVDYLSHPFEEWQLEVGKKKRLTSDFSYVGRNDDCPCNSGKKFKKCCLRKKYLTRNQFNISVNAKPGLDIPAVLDYGVVQGKPRFPFENN